MSDKDKSESVTAALPTVTVPDTETDTDTEKKRGAKRAPKSFLLTEKLTAYAKDKGMDDTTIVEQLEGFMDWEFKSARKDWPACWRTWCRRWKEKNPGKVWSPMKHRTPEVITEAQLTLDRAAADKDLARLVEANA